MFGTVPRLWPESTIVCVGGGPSVTTADLARVHAAQQTRADLRVLAVNSSYVDVHADVLYAADMQWWRWQQAVPDDQLPPRLFTAQPPALEFRPSAVCVRITRHTGLELSPGGLAEGGHGGYQAINLAVHLGARTIVLLGYDLLPQVQADGTVRHHYHPEHPNGSHPTYAERVGVYATLVDPLAALGVTVINASPRTAITTLPRASLESLLPLA